MGVECRDRAEAGEAGTLREAGHFGDVCQPQHVWPVCDEVTGDQGVVDRRPRPVVSPGLLREGGTDLLLRAQPPDQVLAGCNAIAGQFLCDESVPERWIVAVDVDSHVDQVGVVPVPRRDRIGVPLAERLDGAPGRSPQRGSRRRQGKGPAGTSFWGQLAGEVRCCPPQALVLLLK